MPTEASKWLLCISFPYRLLALIIYLLLSPIIHLWSATYHDKAFESAVVKIQRGAENTLNAVEKKSVARFKIDVTATSNDSPEEPSYMVKNQSMW